MALAVVIGHLALGLQLDGSIHKCLEGINTEVHKVNLQLIVESLEKLLLLLLLTVHVIRSITGQVSELIQVLHDRLVVLLELTELIPLPL